MTKLPQSKNMVRVVTSSLLLAGSCLLTTPSLAGEFGLSDLQNAKVAHHLAKQRMLEAQKSPEERERDAEYRPFSDEIKVLRHERCPIGGRFGGVFRIGLGALGYGQFAVMFMR